MPRMRHVAVILVTGILSALVLMANTVSAQTTTGNPPRTNVPVLLLAIIIGGLVELAIVGYWIARSRRGVVGSRQLALWLMLPILAVLIFFLVGGGFTACGA